MKKYRVTVFETQTWEVRAKSSTEAQDKILDGNYGQLVDSKIDSTDVEEIK